jgi:hypothetical protein
VEQQLIARCVEGERGAAGSFAEKVGVEQRLQRFAGFGRLAERAAQVERGAVVGRFEIDGQSLVELQAAEAVLVEGQRAEAEQHAEFGEGVGQVHGAESEVGQGEQ